MGLFDKVNQMSRSVSESSKNAAETSNLKKKIAYEQERIQEQLQEIGRLFYENPDGDHKAELEVCADIDDRKRRIESMRSDRTSRMGGRVCSAGGARFVERSGWAVWGQCGAKLED